MIQRIIGVSIGALVTFLILLIGNVTAQADPVSWYLAAAIIGAIASFFWPILAGFMLARRVRGRRDDAIQREVDRQLAERK